MATARVNLLTRGEGAERLGPHWCRVVASASPKYLLRRRKLLLYGHPDGDYGHSTTGTRACERGARIRMTPKARLAQSDVVVSVSGLVHRFDDGSTLEYGPADITICAGESVAIVGPNGSGKSTLLGHVLGLDVPHAGTVTALGIRAHTLDSRDRQGVVGILQNPDDQVFGPSVRDDVAYGPSNWGGDRRTTREMVDRALRRFGLSDKADRIAHALSAGERRRVALAAAFVGWSADAPERIRLVVMDEPFEALDVWAETALRDLLDEIRHAGRTAVVFATHDLESVPAHAGRVIVLAPGGRVVADGNPLDILGGLGTAGGVNLPHGIDSPDGSVLRRPALLRLRDSLAREGIVVDPTVDPDLMARQLAAIVSARG